MNKRTLSLIILILLIVTSVSTSINVEGDETTIQIEDGKDDIFMTETGNIFSDTYLIRLKDPNYGLMVFLRFNNITVKNTDAINQATLKVYTQNEYDWSDVSVTIYGLDEDNCGPFGDSADLNSRPLTSNYVNWNVSGVYGQFKWNEVNITNIIQVITNRYNWKSGNSIGLKIMSTPKVSRTFTAYEDKPSWSAKLYIKYGETPPTTPQNQANYPYNDTDLYIWRLWKHYRCYNIWKVSSASEWVNYTTFTKIGTAQTKVTVYNYSYVENTNGKWYPYLDVRLEKSYDENETHCVRFGVKWKNFQDTTPSATRYFLVIYGFTQNSGEQFAWNGDQCCIVVRSDLTGNKLWYSFYAYDGSQGYSKGLGGLMTEYPTQHWVVFYYNNDNQRYKFNIYEDINMTKLLFKTTGTHDRGKLVLNYEYGQNNIQNDYSPYDEGNWALYGGVGNVTKYFICKNCTLIDPDPDPDPIKTIDDILDPDPFNPEPDEWEDYPIPRFKFKLWLLISGFIMIFGPVWFMSWRRPTIQQALVSIIIITIGLGLLIHIGHF